MIECNIVPYREDFPLLEGDKFRSDYVNIGYASVNYDSKGCKHG